MKYYKCNRSKRVKKINLDVEIDNFKIHNLLNILFFKFKEERKWKNMVLKL